MICQLTRGRFLSNCVLKNLNTLLYSAYFHFFLINNGFIISNDLENPIAEVLHDINRNGKQIFIKSNMAVGRHLGFIAYRDLRSKLKCHHCTQHGPKPHVKTYCMAIQICFHSIYSHAQISPKIGPFGPYIGPNDPHGGIFPLGNICFYKLGSDRNLWVPLEFCHQGGAWGPLLPTRLIYTKLKTKIPHMQSWYVVILVY